MNVTRRSIGAGLPYWLAALLCLCIASGCFCFDTPPVPEGEGDGGAVEGGLREEGEGTAEGGEGVQEGAPPPEGDPVSGPRRYTYRVVAEYPHDRDAFTQGLVIDRGVLFEGTGLQGRSSLRRVDLMSGVVQQIYELEFRYFGEGITVFGDQIFQLTWTSRVCFVYERDTFAYVGRFNYTTEGWGLTHDGTRLIMSDGSANLYFRDPATFAEIGRVQVRDGGRAIRNLNELEYINGAVYANVWQTDLIAIIDPSDGTVLGWADLTGLLRAADRNPPVDVLNGIAYNAATGQIFVTGKLWPKLFEIELIEQ